MLTNVTLSEMVGRNVEVNIYSTNRVIYTAFHVPCIGYDRTVLKVSLRPIKRYTSIQCEFPFHSPSSLFSFINFSSLFSLSTLLLCLTLMMEFAIEVPDLPASSLIIAIAMNYCYEKCESYR